MVAAVALMGVVAVSAGAAYWFFVRSDRSVEAFCHTYSEEKHRIGQNFAAAGSDPFAGLFSSLSAIGELPVMFDRLDKVAPEDIEPDVAAVRDSFQHQIDAAKGAAGDPLGALAGGTLEAAMNAGAYSRVTSYITQHCPGA